MRKATPRKEKKPKNVWMNNGTETKSVSILEVKNFLAEGWIIGKLINPIDFVLDKRERVDKKFKKGLYEEK